MKARTNSTWSWVHFDNGEIWQVDKYDYVKFLEILLSPSQFEKFCCRDGTYQISNKRYLKAKEFFKGPTLPPPYQSILKR